MADQKTIRSRKGRNPIAFVFILILAVLFLMPIAIVLMNSFKGRFFISDAPFALPNSETYAAFSNYITGVVKIGFASAFGYSTFITIFSVLILVFFTSMTAWYITRVKSKATSITHDPFLHPA